MMEHTLQLGNRAFPLRYTVNSVCCLEERFGKALHQLLQTDVSSVRALIWCGLLHGEKHMTVEDAGNLLGDALEQGQALSEIGGICARALQDAGFFRAAGRQETGRSRSGSNICV